MNIRDAESLKERGVNPYRNGMTLEEYNAEVLKYLKAYDESNEFVNFRSQPEIFWLWGTDPFEAAKVIVNTKRQLNLQPNQEEAYSACLTALVESVVQTCNRFDIGYVMGFHTPEVEVEVEDTVMISARLDKKNPVRMKKAFAALKMGFYYEDSGTYFLPKEKGE